MKACLILTSCPTKSESNKIAKTLLTEKLAACVQISSKIRSCYLWKGRQKGAQEFQLSIKTTSLRAKKCASRIQELHSYEIPEILIIKIDSVLKTYLKWLSSSVS